jgi:hypothetical protein
MSKSSLNNGNPNMVQFSGDNIFPTPLNQNLIQNQNPNLHFNGNVNVNGVETHPENNSFSMKVGGDLHMNVSNPITSNINNNNANLNLGNVVNSPLAINPLGVNTFNKNNINFLNTNTNMNLNINNPNMNNNNIFNQINPNNLNKLPNPFAVNNNLLLNSNILPNPVPIITDIPPHALNQNNPNGASNKIIFK